MPLLSIMKFKKNILIVMFCTFIISPIKVFANPTEIQSSIDSMEQEVWKLDNSIEISQEKLNSLNKRIEEATVETEFKQKEISKMLEEIKEKEEILNNRIRSIYIQNGQANVTTSYLMTIINSESIIKALNNVVAIGKIAKMDKDIIEETKASQTELQEKLEELNVIQKQLADDKDQVEIELALINSNKAEVKTKIEILKIQKATEEEAMRQEQIRIQAELTAKIEAEAKERAEAEAKRKAEAEAEEALRNQNNNLLNNSNDANEEIQRPSRGPEGIPTGTINDVMATTLEYLGVDYVWGGTTPDGFDCSGLMQYAFERHGIWIPRVAEDQQNYGTNVSINNLQPGDLIFWGSPAYHVGMYLGNDTYIHAPQTGDVVKISRLYRNGLSSATRIL